VIGPKQNHREVAPPFALRGESMILPANLRAKEKFSNRRALAAVRIKKFSRSQQMTSAKSQTHAMISALRNAFRRRNGAFFIFKILFRSGREYVSLSDPGSPATLEFSIASTLFKTLISVPAHFKELAHSLEKHTGAGWVLRMETRRTTFVAVPETTPPQAKC
jgi:hypothetical protein